MNNFEMFNRSKDQVQRYTMETAILNSDQRMQDLE